MFEVAFLHHHLCKDNSHQIKDHGIGVGSLVITLLLMKSSVNTKLHYSLITDNLNLDIAWLVLVVRVLHHNRPLLNSLR